MLTHQLKEGGFGCAKNALEFKEQLVVTLASKILFQREGQMSIWNCMASQKTSTRIGYSSKTKAGSRDRLMSSVSLSLQLV